MDTKVIVTSKEELNEILENIILRIDEKKGRGKGEKLYYINQVARMLGKAHETVKKMVENGTIRSTKDKKIPESAIDEYLQRDKK